MLTEAVRQEVPAHNFLDRLLQAELVHGEGRRVKTSLKLSTYRLGDTGRTSTLPFSRRSSVPCIDTLATGNGATAKPCLVQGPPWGRAVHLLWCTVSARSNRASV